MVPAALLLIGLGALAAPLFTLTVAPLVILSVLVSCGHRPGERTLIALRARRIPRRRPLRRLCAIRPRGLAPARPLGRVLTPAVSSRPPPRAQAALS